MCVPRSVQGPGNVSCISQAVRQMVVKLCHKDLEGVV